MNLQSEILKHKKRGELLEAIESFYRRKDIVSESINGFAGTFPSLRKKLDNRIDTINRCIKRFELAYSKI
jgi:hypothetical protein